MTLDCLIEDERWKAFDLPARASKTADVALTRLGLNPATCDISLLACDDLRIADLNAEFRGKPTPTNVLSWPTEDLSAETDGHPPLTPVAAPDGVTELGDMAIAFETCASEAAAAGKTLHDHATHLIVHGVLHLLGYDHVRDQDATLMEGLESEILGIMGVDDPYRDARGANGPHFGLD